MDAATRQSAERTVHALAASIRERDRITYEHSRRVATYAQRLARHMGWSRRLAHDLALAALVHDLGKTWIVNAVLHKPSALSPDERLDMERHPAIGARILEAYGAPTFLMEAVRHHHEAFDGRGYPDGLVGEQIPLAARLLTIADVFDALTSERPYKAGMDASEACARIERGAGTYFDPQVVSPFLALVARQPAFVLPRHSCPVPPAAPPRLNIWYHEALED
jgi:putative two-component system response regulator